MIELADLRGLPVFDGVSDETLNRVVAHVADVRVDEGQWLVREGESPAFYVLLSGTFDLMKRYPDGTRRLAVRKDPGDYLGELPIVFGTPFFAGARATTALRVARLDRAQFGLVVRESQAFSDRLVATIAQRVEGLEAEAAGPLRLPTVIGSSHDPECHALRDFLSRNQVRFEWADPDEDWIAARPDLQDALAAAVDCSVVLLPDGRILIRPTPSEVAVEVGLQVEPLHDTYDLVVVGGGPAGLAAAVYGASEGLRTLLVEREATGGQAGTSTRIENYLGFPSGVSGDDLAARAGEQAVRLGAEIVVTRTVESITPSDECHTVELDGGRSLGARAVILASGVSYRALQADGLDAFAGIGVFYGAARTEAAAMQGRDIILVGGGNSAGQAAVFFADYARTVTILIRGESLDASMSRYLIDELERKPNVHVRPRGEVVRCTGDTRLECVVVRNRTDGSLDEVDAHALFIFIGADANTGWLPPQIICDDRGFVCTGRDVTDLMPEAWPLERDPYLLETSVPGIFSAGDVRHGSIKRVASGVGEGSIAIAFVHEHLADLAARREVRAPAT
ncbi:MAG: thioredoxin reductase [Gaiellales bacterium]|nr:thioredoxin reductase [Gaiellales bacterium]